MHWVEVSRAIGNVPAEVEPMVEAYGESATPPPAWRARRRHRARRPPRRLEGLHGAWLPPRPRHRPLDRDDDDRAPPRRRGAGDDAPQRDGLSMHPHAIAQDGKACLYMQDTWLVTDAGGEPLLISSGDLVSPRRSPPRSGAGTAAARHVSGEFQIPRCASRGRRRRPGAVAPREAALEAAGRRRGRAHPGRPLLERHVDEVDVGRAHGRTRRRASRHPRSPVRKGCRPRRARRRRARRRRRRAAAFSGDGSS